ncbi:hypothetical protein MANI_002524 [Metarhizium anisopliae]
MPILNNQRGRTMAVRRVGQSKNDPAPRLLTIVGGSSRQKVAENVDDPPVSSDDEGESDNTLETDSPMNAMSQSQSPLKGSQTSRARNTKKISSFVGSSDSCGDGDERVVRANIKSTSFDTPQQTRSKRKDSPIEREEKSEDLDSKRRKTGTQRKEPRNTPPTSSGEHLKNELGLPRTRKSKITYKRREQSSQEQPVRKRSTDTRVISRSIPSGGTGKKKEPAKLQVPSSLPSSPQSPERPKMDRLRLPSGPSSSSPPSKPTLKLYNSIKSPQQSARSRRLKKKEKSEAKGRSPSPPPAIFKMPVSISDLQLRSPRKGRIEESLTDDPSDMENQDGQAEKPSADDGIKNVEAETVCPWCGEPVDKKFLDDFAKGRRLNVRLQSKFCQKHKKQTAKELWQQKSYPEVEWDGLEDRFEKYHKLLLGVINGGVSHFRFIHEKNILSGKARSMKKEDNMVPGYYGPRGFNLMCDYLVNEFSELLREKAVDDRVIAGRGSAAFIQTVLVAELAVRLIMEDMKVAEEEARAILDESKALGEMIHGET